MKSFYAGEEVCMGLRTLPGPLPDSPLPVKGLHQGGQPRKFLTPSLARFPELPFLRKSEAGAILGRLRAAKAIANIREYYRLHPEGGKV